MPVTLTITADTLSELTDILSSAKPVFATVSVEAPEKPKATRSTKAKSENLPEQKTGDPSPTTDPAPAVDAGEPTPSSTDAEPATEASLRVRATKFASQGGPQALIEMQKAAGAAGGKMSEIVASQDAMTKLDALLADAGF